MVVLLFDVRLGAGLMDHSIAHQSQPRKTKFEKIQSG
jgi:hypothetical protein